MNGRPVLAAIFGAIGGPLSYMAGERLGAIALGDPRWRSLLVLSISWAVAMPLLMALSQWRMFMLTRYEENI